MFICEQIQIIVKHQQNLSQEMTHISYTLQTEQHKEAHKETITDNYKEKKYL